MRTNSALLRVVPAHIEIFRARCEARATLVGACDLDLQTAVDELQESAVVDGLVAGLGQDIVQAVMAQSFARVRKSCRPEAKSLGIVEFSEQQRSSMAVVGSSILSAAKYLISQNDPERLRVWLAKHTEAERIALLKRLRGAKHE